MDAERLIGLLAESNRRRVVAALVLGASSRSDVAMATGLTTREIVEAEGRLVSAGLVEPGVDGELILLESAFERAARPSCVSRAHDTSSVGGTHDSPEQIVLGRAVVDGRIVAWPSKQSKQLIVADWLVQRFEPGKRYSEASVNHLVGQAHADTAAMRRYLVDFGMLDRANGEYWRAGGTVVV